MERNDLVGLIIGILVMLLIGGSFILYLSIIYRQKIKLIKHGIEDKEIKKEYIKEHKKSNIIMNKIANGFSVFLCVLFCGVFFFSIYAQTTGNDFPVPGIKSARVVQSSSMSEKRKENTYLFENNLNDQFGIFDIILTEELPNQFDLKVWDIVVYEVDEILIVHRIVGIEEPNEKHPEERWFTLKGDANISADRFPVKYDQMKAIYTGEYIPYCGAFIMFFQSTLGYLLIAVLLVYAIAAPYSQRALEKATKARLIEIGFIEEEIKEPEPRVVAYKAPDVQDIFHEEFLKVMDDLSQQEAKKEDDNKDK